MTDYYTRQKIKAAEFRYSRLQAKRLIDRLLKSDVTETSGRNKFLIQIAVLCLRAVVALINTRTHDV